jgi:hypothetical protein
MEPTQTPQPLITDKPKNYWKLIAIVSVMVAILLTGLTAFLVIKSNNSQREKETADSVISQLQTKNATEKEKPIEQQPVPEKCEEVQVVAPEPVAPSVVVDNARYLTVNEWGMKFKIPDEFLELSYKLTNSNATISFYGVVHPVNVRNDFGTLTIKKDPLFYYTRYAENNDSKNRPFVKTEKGFNYYFEHAQSILSEDFRTEQLADYLLQHMVVTAEYL